MTIGETGQLATEARFHRAADARQAIDRLSRLGIEAGRISLDAGMQDDGDGRPSQRRMDAGTTRRLGVRLGKGAVIGAVLGAVVGLAVVVVFATAATVPLLIAGAAGGAVAMGWLGALVGLQSTPTMSRAWESSFDPADADPVILRVEHGSDEQVDRIREVLESAGAAEVGLVTRAEGPGSG